MSVRPPPHGTFSGFNIPVNRALVKVFLTGASITTWLQHPEVRRWLGCPFTNFRQNEHAARAAVQTFQHGWMLWLETDTVANVDPIYVFYEDNHSYVRYGDRKLVDAHSCAPTPQGFYKVGDRFAKIYWEDIGAQGWMSYEDTFEDKKP